jgi:phosphoglycolate phosphatase
MKGFDTIIWDWNGTLLNDIDICIESINCLLTDRKLPLLSREKYLELFGFPVIEYYKKIGFDFQKEPFEIPAKQYVDIYTSKIVNCLLHDSAIEVLTFFKNKGFRQMLLSASELGILEKSINHFNLLSFFETITGLDNLFASSKTEIGFRLFKDFSIVPEKTCFIGDTIHDFEVANILGCQCILVADGHQSFSKLKGSGAFVTEKLKLIPTLLDL